MNKHRYLKTLFIFTIVCVPPVVQGIPSEYKKVADHYGIPHNIFYAIALTESGQSREGIYRPWPWSLNVGGEARRFSTFNDAQRSLASVRSSGKHADVGIMQVNSLWHAHRVNHLHELLDPYVNLRVAAIILLEQKKRSDTWWEAVGKYHAPGADSSSKARANQYRIRVKKRYDTYVSED